MTYNQKIPPFKWFILENFPYIEEDFDALTNWQLFCKLGKEMNKIIEKTNLTGEQVEQLTTAFNELKAYIDNYFENLDVQDEIDNKLDEMAEQGVLTDIIAQYLQLAGVLAYDNKQAMKQAQNLADGSIAKTLGKTTYQDGQGAFYKVRQIQNTDVVDDNNIIALHDPDLVAEKILFSSGYEIQSYLQGQIDQINRTKILFIGDSYLEMYNGTTGVIDKFKTISGITNVSYAVKSGTGFAYTVDDQNFVTLLQSVANDNELTDIICVGGYNDQYSNQNDVENAISNFCTIAKQKFPNAKIYIGMDSFTLETTKRFPIYNTFVTYQKCNKYGAKYLNGVECVMHDTNLFIGGNDLTHPNENGRFEIARAIYQAWATGQYNYNIGYLEIPFSFSGDATGGTFTLNGMIINNNTYILQQKNNAIINFNNHPSYSDIHEVDIEIGTLTMNTTNAIFSPWPYNMYSIPITCVVLDSAGYRTMSGDLIFVNNKINIRFEDVEPGNWTDINNLEYIEINSCQAIFPTIMC